MTIPRAVEMAPQLKPCTAFGQDPDSVLNVHVGDLTSTCKSSTGVSVPSSGLGGICTHVHIHTDTHILFGEAIVSENMYPNALEGQEVR